MVPLGRICKGKSLCSVWGRPQLKPEVGENVWPQSSLRYSESKNCKSPKDDVSSRLSSVGRLALGNLSCSLQASDCEMSARIQSWWGQ